MERIIRDYSDLYRWIRGLVPTESEGTCGLLAYALETRAWSLGYEYGDDWGAVIDIPSTRLQLLVQRARDIDPEVRETTYRVWYRNTNGGEIKSIDIGTAVLDPITAAMIDADTIVGADRLLPGDPARYCLETPTRKKYVRTWHAARLAYDRETMHGPCCLIDTVTDDVLIGIRRC